MSENIIFNYDYFVNTFNDQTFQKYIINKDGLESILKEKAPSLDLHKSLNKTTIDYLLEKCFALSHSNGKKYFKNSPKIKKKKHLSVSHVSCFHEYFSPECPVFLDVNRFLRSMLISSNLLFNSSNLKLCLVAMVDRDKIEQQWTASDIFMECKNYTDTQKIQETKIEQCLEKYSSQAKYTFFEKSPELKEGKNQYSLNLTQLILYYNAFLKEKEEQ